MAIKKFSEILGNRAKVDLEFVDIQEDETAGGLAYVKLILKNPIPLVTGGKRRDNTSGETIGLEAADVEVVSINPDALKVIDELEEAGTAVFSWVDGMEGKAGKLITSDLRLDVSNNLDVWVVKESFAAWAKGQRDSRNQKRNTGLMNKMNEAKAKRTLKDVDVTTAESVGA